MERLSAAPGSNRGNKIKLQHSHFNDVYSQRQAILDWLHHSPLTTLEARSELGIMPPAARVQELREQGFNIVTHRTIAADGKRTHRVACYVLLSGGLK